MYFQVTNLFHFRYFLKKNYFIGCWEIWTCDLVGANQTCYPLSYRTLNGIWYKILPLRLRQEVNTYIVERGVKSGKVNRTNPSDVYMTTNLKSIFVTDAFRNMSKFCTTTLRVSWLCDDFLLLLTLVVSFLMTFPEFAITNDMRHLSWLESNFTWFCFLW